MSAGGERSGKFTDAHRTRGSKTIELSTGTAMLQELVEYHPIS